MLRVYRTGWRTPSDILYEMDVLNHLAGKGVPVSTPVARRDGSFVRELRAQEGPRPAALFTYAPGKEAYTEEDYPQRYGSAVAAVHNAMDDFHSPHRRFSLDLGHLLDQQLAAIRPLVHHRPEDWQYFAQLGEKLRQRVTALPVEQLETGYCHGDFHGGNAHVDGETLTFFDFDCGGPGWRAYEIAVFLWNAVLAKKEEAEPRWAAFLEGYTAVRPLKALDLAAVPLFVAIRHLWWMGLQCGNARDWGYGDRGDRFFDRGLTFLREWEHDRIDAPVPDAEASQPPSVAS
jgi:Ser/Thr protein kinase RdoA (MazF antagonist)